MLPLSVPVSNLPVARELDHQKLRSLSPESVNRKRTDNRVDERLIRIWAIYAPLTAGILQPFGADEKLPPQKRTQLDKLYQQVTDDLGNLMDAVGLKAA